MRKIAAACLAIVLALPAMAQDQDDKADYPIRPVPFTDVKIKDNFFRPRIETNRTVTIPYAFEQCEATDRINNFAFAAGLKEGVHQGAVYNDSDVYKIIEGAAYSLAAGPDLDLEAYVDRLVELIAAAQEDDGYIYTTRTALNTKKPPRGGAERWSDVRWGHELYDMGHLYEAAVAYYQATGKRALLDVALKSAELVCGVFGPEGRQEPTGHQEIEIGLVKLYRVTGEEKYLRQAALFLERRGKGDGRELFGEYAQDHKQVTEQDEAVGHAVRAAYMYAAMADVAAITGDRAFVGAIERIWENVVGRKLYLTGGIGATGSGEAFAANYELPNMSAYCETCASIANVFWNHRMFLLSGESKYIDVLERTLYNAALAGVSFEGDTFFYPNPLESVGQHKRSPWFSCACCPGNVTRFVASMPGYVYATGPEGIYINLFAAGEADIDFNGRAVKLTQETDYPWDGKVRIIVEPEGQGADFAVLIRIPGWALGRPLAGDLYRYVDGGSGRIELRVNGEVTALDMRDGYAAVSRSWRQGDDVELVLPMEVHRVVAHEAVAADRGRVALERGPIVFCAEWPDNEGGHVRNLLLPDDSELTTEFREDLLGGVQVIRGRAVAYSYKDDRRRVETRPHELAAIPYYAWAHRGEGEMTVWLARDEQAVHPPNEPTLASISFVSASFGSYAGSVNDQLEPESSGDHQYPYFHWWPHKGTVEWVQYDFPEPREVSIVEVYWFDDTGEGECRVPKSWRALYREGDEWKPFWTEQGYGVEKDCFNKVVFETVKTTAVRLEIQAQEGYAGGIHEWRIK